MNNFYRKKLLHTILFFAKKINRPNMTMMFKLLNWFDFEHFCETGYPAIGLKYYTFERGPVPKELWLEFKNGIIPEDFKDYLSTVIEEHSTNKGDFIEYLFKAKPKVKLDISIFSQREIEILDRLVLQFKHCNAKIMSKISHEKDRPWTITRDKLGYGKIIDYKLALQQKDICVSDKEASETLKEHFEMLNNFNLKPT